jgi:hypothetical protein
MLGVAPIMIILLPFIRDPLGFEGCSFQGAEVFDTDFRRNHELFLEGLLQAPPKGLFIAWFPGGASLFRH